jgi:hypothetical protein
VGIRIQKYDRGFSRRHFLDQLTNGILVGGVLSPLWNAMANSGDISAAYPEELLSIESYTRGALGAGDIINSGNVGGVRELLDPIQFTQIAEMGRQLKVLDTTTDIMQLSPWEYQEATIRNKGRARFADDGNVVTADGRPWIGGNPFPDPRSAVEAVAAATLSWGRHDSSLYTVFEEDFDDTGERLYKYEVCWAELAPVGRVVMDPKPYWPGHEDKLRYQSIVFTAPNDIKGTSFLNIWDYDQNEFPELYGYIPSFRRVRKYPTNQRFEPLIPGSTLYLSDAWATGDPFLTWGNYRIVGRGPCLAGVTRNWPGEDNDWRNPESHGGARGKTFWRTNVELVPEAIVVEAEPTHYPRAPVSRKKIWFDLRTGLPLSMVTYDRKGLPFKSFDGCFSIYSRGESVVMDGAHPYWSWAHVHAHDVRTNRVSRLEQVRKIGGGHHMRVNDESIYDRYLTVQALRRFYG